MQAADRSQGAGSRTQLLVPCFIAVIAPPWYPVPPSGYGGIESVVALLADGLTDRGLEVTLLASLPVPPN